MIIDYLDGSCPDDFEADICIIGAGAAGIAMARSFIGTRRTVCLIESGGIQGEESSQALCEGTSAGQVPFDVLHSRMRAFGGSCNLWGGGCTLLDAHDLAHRDWIPLSGWPLSSADLLPWYEKALAFCGMTNVAIAEDSLAGKPDYPPLKFSGRSLMSRTCVRSGVIFGKTYRDELHSAPNVRVILHTNLVKLRLAESGGAVKNGEIRSLTGRCGTVSARRFALCCGAIENARVLLASNEQTPLGIGNARDMVGRHFMDHPFLSIGNLKTRRPEILTRPFGRPPAHRFPAFFSELGLSRELQQDLRLLNARVHPFAVEGEVPLSIQAWRRLRKPSRGAEASESELL